MSKPLDLKDKRFGMLVVLKRVENTPKGKSRWLCKCDCGTKKIITGNALQWGNTTSCGCNKYKKIGFHHRTHGYSGTRLHRIWKNIKVRCYYKGHKEYCNYGGRGITVCSEWRNDSSAFINWALTHGYSDKLTLDRYNNNGNYEPSNCHWVTMKEQSNNKRNSYYITIDNETHTLTEWCEIYNVSYNMIRRRLEKGWDLLTAIAVPPLNRIGIPIYNFIEEP